MILYVRHGASKSKHRNKILNADKHSPASSARSTKRWVSGMLMSVGVESSHWQIAKRLRSWASSEADCECPLYILYGGICGSDLGTYRGNLPYVSYPRIPGHEFSARVVEADENEYGIKSGMIVTANPYFNKSQIFSAASPAVPVFLISNFAYLR